MMSLLCAIANPVNDLLGAASVGLFLQGVALWLAYFASQRARPLIPLMLCAAGLVSCSVSYAIKFPKTRMARMSSEGSSKGNLQMLRRALARFSENRKQPPKDLAELTDGSLLKTIPLSRARPYHPDSSAVRQAASADDSGGWVYDGARVWINCTHTDSKGLVWTTY